MSGGHYALSHPAAKRATLPPRLSAIRSVSQPANFIDLTSRTAGVERSNAAAYWGNTEVVTSPDVIHLDDDFAEPPAKRVKTEGADLGGIPPEESDETDEAHRIRPGSPLPSLPLMKAFGKRHASQRRNRFGIDPAARKAHGIDPPSAATRVPAPKKAADFAPWSGHHPEDVLNEEVVKNGYFDRVQGTNQTEFNSARATISSSLNQKNSQGLGLLSFLFTSVLDKKQTIGKCTAPSTFKPPPRVTVTDTKREAWLRDLANPEVPLRKQSRTIPHGIRGKLLMEQCSTKAIPLQRAVWLAKCVGANELRAFRRKGVSGSAAANGELKWVGEWTMHVEQFLDDVIVACGQKDWQQKMNYAVKLSAALYSEKLLDKSHYLDWIVSSLADAAIDRLPISIILAQLYWKEIIMYGRRGRRLAEALLEHLNGIVKRDLDGESPLKIRLQKLIAVLAVSNRGCLIIPRTWTKYKHLLASISVDDTTMTPLKSIYKRNERLIELKTKHASNTRSAVLDLYAELDAVKLAIDVEDLVERCLNYVPDTSQLVPALSDWASTPYRMGSARVYLVARIIAQLHNTNRDTDAAVLQYLGAIGDVSAGVEDRVHRLIVELVHLQAFSVGRYLQWLITSGVLSTGAKRSVATSIIAALPIIGLPLHVSNTRKTMMRRLGYAVDENSARTTECLDSVTSDTEYFDKHGLTLSAQFSLCDRLCTRLDLAAKGSGMSLNEFCVTRRLIESCHDLRSLARLVRMATTTDNSALLATACETINLNAESLAAMGDLDGLIDGACEKYLATRSQQLLDRAYITSLVKLTERFPGKATLLKLLCNDLSICDQQSSVSVCSPASDSLTGMHASTLDTDEDLDAVFASGNTMDEQLMQRVFERVMRRASDSKPAGLEPVSRVCGWLSQLKVIDSGGAFEKLVRDYIDRGITGATDYHSWSPGIVHLVVSGCLSLSTVATTADQVKSTELASHMLPLFLSITPIDGALHPVEAYRFRLQQKSCMVEHAGSLLTLLRTACENPAFVATNPDVVDFAIRAGPSHKRVVADESCSEVQCNNIGRLVSAILMRGCAGEQDNYELDVAGIMRLATPLSVNFCSGSLRYLRNNTLWTEYDEEALGNEILDAFNNRSDIWPQLLESAGEAVNKRIHEWAQDRVLQSTTERAPGELTTSSEDVQRFLSLLAISRQLTTLGDDTGNVNTITLRLKQFEEGLIEFGGTSEGVHERQTHLLDRLRTTLQLATLDVSAPKEGIDTSLHAKIRMLGSMCSLIVHPGLQLHPDVLEHLIDVASALSDNLSEPALATVRQQFPNRLLSDRRISFILGKDEDILHTCLTLASPIPPVGSQQQRLLNRQPSQHQQMPGRPAMPGSAQHQRVASGSVPGFWRQDSRMLPEMKTTPFAIRLWEIIPDAAPVMGGNDASLSLRMFGARKI